ncbi:nitroreductase family protein [Limisphaera sp. 4302-co]|uniref:nitroreductase family protein n=1 Tax=Limisphaera sp. 4302-co TaxID=3400417 RepID=UPI003C26E1C7
MKNRIPTCCVVLGLLLGPAFPPATCAQDAGVLPLPKPRIHGGKPLLEALQERRSTRAFRSDPLPPEILGNLLWAAFGVNRPDGHRTAPSAMNHQEIDVYVATADGVFVYDARAHALQKVHGRDVRAATGLQDFVATAPVNLVLVADWSRMSRVPEERKPVWSAVSAGAIVQNVYLFCASEGLATVVRGTFDESELARALNLRPEQKIVVAQTVGWPAGTAGTGAARPRHP